MEAFLFLFISLAFSGLKTTAWAGKSIISPSKLKMFVDELPDMPRVQGFDIKNGVPVPKTLIIGMFYKKWVRISIL